MSNLAVRMNFSWIEENRLAACRSPRLASELAFLRDNGLKALVRLEFDEETGISAAAVQRYGMRDCYEPMPDFTAPSRSQLNRTVRFIEAALMANRPVAVCCGAGYGRTGTIIASYLTTTGYDPDAAIAFLIEKRPGTGELLRVSGQRAAIEAFYRGTDRPQRKESRQPKS